MHANLPYKLLQSAPIAAGTFGTLQMLMVLLLMDIRDISAAWLDRSAYKGMLTLSA